MGIALKEFPKLSSRAIAEMCGVGDQLVRTICGNDQVRDSRTSTVTGQDGKQYPSTRRQREPKERAQRGGERRCIGEPGGIIGAGESEEQAGNNAQKAHE